MKSLVLLSMAFVFTSASVTDENETLLKVYTLEKDVKNSSLYYFQKFTNGVDQAIMDGKIKVYSDKELKNTVDLVEFKKETLMPQMRQYIDPSTPYDPYNLIDSQLFLNKAVNTCNHLVFSEKVIEVNTNTLNGIKTYYLSDKQVNKKGIEGYSLVKVFSFWYGKTDLGTLNQKAGDFLSKFSEKLYSPAGALYSDENLSKLKSSNSLWDSVTYYAGEPNETLLILHPADAKAINGIVFSYEGEKEAKEVSLELELESVAPTYELSTFNKYVPWYWSSVKDTKKLFSATEWNALTEIQTYIIYKKVYSYFDFDTSL